MTSRSLQVSNAAVVDRQSETEPQAVSSNSSKVDSARAASLGDVKLPYQVDHQVELLHLRAEAEALLQELQTLKQRRLVAVGSNISN
ncbi:hypothetical protein H6G89_11170 [Oscillatoria sp. FACHB-1407]|uniref:hypothetical protein n=1 Tax=Oscillatoria sp. FACHB-1407 TaxID=2692847 RepID=UPI0016827503|nr:hypothetical protein [Oscillatoria sp. FACHB-1407]MBD2461611.1 hypothetical protein [Oscillatoria sp. FACHB-1407]